MAIVWATVTDFIRSCNEITFFQSSVADIEIHNFCKEISTIQKGKTIKKHNMKIVITGLNAC